MALFNRHRSFKLDAATKTEQEAGMTSELSRLESGLSDAQVADIVQRSWQYVAMYNVNN